MGTQSGRVAVIGASGALGSRIARRLRETHDLALLVRDPQRLPEDLTSLPTHLIDLRTPDSLPRALEAATDGRLTGIVHAAGVVAFGAFGETPSAVTDELMLVNAISVTRMLDAAATLVDDGGFVLNLTGVAADMALTGMGAYCASKAAAGAALKVAGRELRRRRIRVVDVRLGHCETGLANRSLHGSPPRMPVGIEPDLAAERIVRAILGGETDLPVAAFGAA